VLGSVALVLAAFLACAISLYLGELTGNALALGAALILGGVLIASAGALWLSRRISAPIEQLTAASARIGGMDLHRPIAVTSPIREIDALAQSLEQMRLNLARAQTVLETTAEHERQAERALQESRELLLESQRLGKLGYVMTDLASGRSEISESLIAMLDLPPRDGYGPGEVRELVHPDDVGPLDAARAAAAEGTYEFRARDGSGAYRWFEGKRRVRRGARGEPAATLWVLIDVTERKKREEALRRGEERHRLILEHSGDGMAVIRPDGKMIYRSPSLGSEALGYREADVLGQSLFDRMHPGDVAENQAALRRLVATPGGRDSGRVRMRHANGGWRQLAWTARNATNVPGIDGILINWHDLTEITRLQDQLQQAQKLEALGQLAGGIAHDFNNVLGAMLGFADFLVQDLPADSPQYRYARSIVRAGQDARDLVAQILAFARRGNVERKPCDLARVLREAKALLRGALPATTELAIEAAPGGLVAEVNLAQMSQVMLNLCLNASDALAGAPGRIAISLARLDPASLELETAQGEAAESISPPATGRCVIGALDPTQAYARITVADNGPGMDETVLARIFDPFFTTKEQGRGTGLGLAVVQSIIAAYGGACIVQSRPGGGTRFSIYLPLKSAASIDAASAEVAPIRGRGERIMVIDDDVATAEMLRSGLERLGYKVVSLADPRRALELFATRPRDWDVVISDQIMPHVTGTSLFEQMKAIRPSVRFILCTGFDAGASREHARDLGIAAWFAKPVLPQEISAEIARLMQAKRAARDKAAGATLKTADTDAGDSGTLERKIGR
jgi:PAS domain S-box-containing protein